MESAAVGAFLNNVMGRLFPLLEKEYKKHRSLARETESIKEDLRMIAAAMDDQISTVGRHECTAIARRHSAVILDLAHDIEDCVDRFTHRLKCKPRGGSGAVSSLLVHRVIPVVHELKKIQSRSSYADEIYKLKKRLKQARQRIIDSAPVGQPNGLPCMLDGSRPSRAVTSDPVGIKKSKEELMWLLREVDGEPQQLRVISIVGFGGLGKTTLARAVYDSLDGPHAKEIFECRAWVSATDTSPNTFSERIKVILHDILRQVVPKDSMDSNVDDNLEASLKDYLSDKRYLIVIDDVQMDEWGAIKPAFVDSSTGSRIILTTTIQSVANGFSHGNGYVYQMNTLGEEDSKKIALLGIGSPELHHGSAGLLEKCDGLPLALVSVYNYLKSSTEPTGELCAKLCRNLGSHLKEKHDHGDTFSGLTKVLLDNYDSLPGYALSCLLYLAIFPNNRPLKKKVVTRRWLAEGYARSESLCDEQDIADDNFNKLVDWNIIQPIDTRNNSQVKTFRTQGIMHEFVLYKSMSHRFIMTLPPDHPRVGSNANNARHLSVHAGKLRDCVASDEDLSRVRSLTVFGEAGGAISYVRKCKLIRVLDLEECTDDLKDEEFEHICKLWHLKYLSLGHTVCELPRCIYELHCLETLDLRRTKIKSLPLEAIQLPHLTRLFGKVMLDMHDLKNVKKMSKLEKFLCAKKSNLQTLAGFVADDSKGFICSKKEDSKGFLQFIMDMSKLRKVQIWCKRVANRDSYISDLSKAIQKFTKVPIDRDNDCSLTVDFEKTCDDFLSSLNLEPCSEGSKYDLRSLKLHGKLSLLPPFVTLFSGLTDLCISSATLTRGLLSALENLGNLLYLKLVADLLEGFEIKQGAFPSLRRLCFQVQRLNLAPPTTEQGAWATIEQGALPYLVSLQLLCRDLVVTLSGINIKHLSYLKEVTIDADEATAHAKRWEHAVKTHPNRPRLMFAKTANPNRPRVMLVQTADQIESEEVGPCAKGEKPKRSPARPSLDDELDSSLSKMRLSECSSWNQVIVHSVMGADTMASSSNPIPLHADESRS